MRGIADLQQELQFTFNHFIVIPLPNIIQLFIKVKPTVSLLDISPPKPIIMTSIFIIKLSVSILLSSHKLPAIIRAVPIEQIPDPCDRLDVHKPSKIAIMIVANDRKQLHLTA